MNLLSRLRAWLLTTTIPVRRASAQWTKRRHSKIDANSAYVEDYGSLNLPGLQCEQRESRHLAFLAPRALIVVAGVIMIAHMCCCTFQETSVRRLTQISGVVGTFAAMGLGSRGLACGRYSPSTTAIQPARSP
uniref:Uncharacterized protein n=1 Tax=Plectus sambesii TaxID=2011161 RepID=A0A914WMF6_9BILA